MPQERYAAGRPKHAHDVGKLGRRFVGSNIRIKPKMRDRIPFVHPEKSGIYTESPAIMFKGDLSFFIAPFRFALFRAAAAYPDLLPRHLDLQMGSTFPAIENNYMEEHG